MEDAEKVIDTAKSLFPKMSITKEDLMRPTQAFVERFYTQFLQTFDQYYRAFTDDEFVWNINMELVDNEHEELCAKVSSIIGSLHKFNLSDIYIPTAKRTRTFIQICIHFLLYMENNINGPSGNLVKEKVKLKEKEEEYYQRKEELVEIVNNNFQPLLQCESEHEKLSEIYKDVSKKQREMQEEKAASEVEWAESRRLVKQYKSENMAVKEEIKKIVTTEAELQEKVVSKSEHEHLLSKFKSLQEDERNLEHFTYDNMRSGLSDEKQNLQILQESANIFKGLKFDTVTLKMISDAENTLDCLNYEISTLNTKLSDLEATKNELHKEEEHLNTVLSQVTNEMNAYSEQSNADLLQKQQKYEQMKKEFEVVIEEKMKKIEHLNAKINKAKNNMSVMKETVYKRYNETIALRDEVLKKFSEL